MVELNFMLYHSPFSLEYCILVLEELTQVLLKPWLSNLLGWLWFIVRNSSYIYLFVHPLHLTYIYCNPPKHQALGCRGFCKKRNSLKFLISWSLHSAGEGRWQTSMIGQMLIKPPRKHKSVRWGMGMWNAEGSEFKWAARKGHTQNMTSSTALQKEEAGPCGYLKEEKWK